ncbi:MAG: ABC transporter permease, partial [Spirochaetales bacterium]|nr:ABC transporter permease [Spirochaetales bacterium]
WEHLFSVYRQTYRDENGDTDKQKLPDKIKLTFKDKWTQFYHLLARNMTNKFHGKRFMLMSVLMPLCLGGIALFLRDFSGAYHFRDNDQIPKFLFLTGIIIIFLAVSNSINDILNEKYVIRKERLIGYSAVVYFLSKLIAQTIISIYQILIYQTVSFVILGFPILTDIVFFLRMYLFTLVSSVSVITIALMLSAFIGTEKQAFMIIPIFIIPQIVFGGMFINYNEISFKLTPGRPVSEICDVMHARWMFESYIALMQTHEVNNTGVNDFFVDYNLVSDKTGGKSGTKYSTPASVVFTRRVNMMSDPKTRSQYLKQNHNYAMGNVNIFPSVNKLFYTAVIPTYYYNMLVMILFMFICSVIAVIRVKKEK